MVFTCEMRELQDTDSGWWVVAYTELAIKTAAYVFMNLYDTFRLWAHSRHMMNAVVQRPRGRGTTVDSFTNTFHLLILNYFTVDHSSDHCNIFSYF